MIIFPYKQSQLGRPSCWDESSKMPPQAIFDNQKNVKATKLPQQAE
jgi:hypothetical protein